MPALGRRKPAPRGYTAPPPASAGAGHAQVAILRHSPHAPPQPQLDQVADEEPLEIQVDRRPVAVLMRTPGHDLELAAGFLLSEGVLRSRSDLFDIGHCVADDANSGNTVGVTLTQRNNPALRRLQRSTFTGSSCGTCGKASIAAIHLQFPPLARSARPRPEVLALLPERLRQGQEIFQNTGGLHAAALFDKQGRILILREDVGRHNAVDKVLGRALLDGLRITPAHILFVSGRVSFEIMQKALAARIGIVAAISAPTSLAVSFARASRQKLAGFVRDGSFNLYTP